MKLVQMRSQNTRALILRSAKVLFQDLGFEAVSMDMLAQTAQISKASIFAHFRDKTSILATLGIEDAKKLVELTRAFTENGLSLDAGHLMETYKPWLSYFFAYPDFARLYLVQSGLIQSDETHQFIKLCTSHETLLINGLVKANPSLNAVSATIARGAQAHFQQIIVYRISGWIGNNDEATAMLKEALEIWCAGVGKLYSLPA